MKNKNINLKIRPSILSLFILVIGIVTAITLFLQYYFLKELALKATNDSLQKTSLSIEENVYKLDKDMINLISNVGAYLKTEKIDISTKNEKILYFISNHLLNNDFIYSIYFGNENEDFYQLINLKTEKKLEEMYKVGPDVHWLLVKIHKIDGKRFRYEYFYNNNFKLIKQVVRGADYFPTTRPWYKLAKETKEIVKTDPYVYANLQQLGKTYAQKTPDESFIIGIDLSLENMSEFLKKQVLSEETEIYHFKTKENLTASANASDKYNNIDIDKLVNKISNIKEDYISDIYVFDDKEYFTYISKLATLSKSDEYLLVLLPLDKILNPYIEKISKSFLITFLVLLIIVPIIWYSTKILTNPIDKLIDENEKIINRDFKNVKHIDTYIFELNELSSTLTKLSESVEKYEADQRNLMDSFIKIIAGAIDAKSKYTGKHCERVPILSNMIVKAAHNDQTVFKDFKIKNSDEERELNIAAWLHDCGKVTTPEYVVDKGVKLETIYNRIHEIRSRFEVIYRDLHIQALENILNGKNKDEEFVKLEEEQAKLKDDFEFVAKSNIGGEFMENDDIERIKQISKRVWTRYFDNSIGITSEESLRLKTNINNKTPMIENLLSDKKEHIIKREESTKEMDDKYGFKQEVPEHLYNLGEVYNLCIKRGTLSDEERYKINEHMKMSIVMLEQLPFQENLKRVPEYAGAHHETLDGKGYPRKLTKDQMSLPARVLAVADVFEALTSSDRPYKDAKKLSTSIDILHKMVLNNHLDKDIFELFLREKVYLNYANEYLNKEQIDEVDISKYLA